ncbi:isochorismate synthase [Ochrovirga pacifica]|uniref:isochorismate synthase n=1 Tax=Ochrovirga pacifica TaxID=1042376 RepID=UPI00025591D6|nr:isochorismate synthase [Ochrovirga pacifica]
MKILQEITQAIAEEKPFVSYRNPNEKQLHLWVQNSKELKLFTDFNQSGFVFAPFDDAQTAYLLFPDKVFVDTLTSESVKPFSSVSIKDNKQDKQKHINLVNSAIKTIKTTEISKVVVSRKETIKRANFNCVQSFKNLLAHYTNAYCYVWYHPKVGLWMGATPETLLKVHQQQFTTMALAGTLPYQGSINATWGAKELEEQKMVTDYIESHLKPVVSDLSLSDVETVKAGNLLHLRTKISGSLDHCNSLKNIVDLLHPTPAVCGLPKEQSKAFILANENYNRSFYTGYLGVVNWNAKTELFVNLRCLNWVNNLINLYVGGGITAQSIAEKEWEETQAKSQVMKKILV